MVSFFENNFHLRDFANFEEEVLYNSSVASYERDCVCRETSGSWLRSGSRNSSGNRFEEYPVCNSVCISHNLIDCLAGQADCTQTTSLFRRAKGLADCACCAFKTATLLSITNNDRSTISMNETSRWVSLIAIFASLTELLHNNNFTDKHEDNLTFYFALLSLSLFLCFIHNFTEYFTDAWLFRFYLG